MNVLVTYMSQTGNTKKVAEAIYDEINEDKKIKDMDSMMERATELSDFRNIENYDLIFIGFPIQQFGIPDKVRDFFERKLQPQEQVLRMGKKQKSTRKDVALFITHGAPEDFEQLPKWIAKAEDAASKGANVIDVFQCQGEVSQKIMDMLQNSDDPQMQEFAKLVATGKGQPDETKLNKAREFARKVITQKKTWG